LIKANDSLGFSYKLVEYFGEKALNMPYFEPFALELAILICIAEIVLGLAVLVGGKSKLTAALMMAMILFFTWLTYYTATCDPFEEFTVMRDGVEVVETKECVMECGCFGNAIPLTPWESFYKDVVLLFFISIIFIAAFFTDRIKFNSNKEDLYVLPISLLMIAGFSAMMLDWLFPVLFTFLLFAAYLLIKRWKEGSQAEWFTALSALIISGIFQYYTLVHLPIKDYRPYAIGNSIREGMMSAEELGKEPPVNAVEYTFTNLKSGADTIILSTDFLDKKLYADSTFMQKYEVKSYEGKTIELKPGYEPPISDFLLESFEGEDMTSSIIDDPGIVFLQVCYDLEKTNTSNQKEINAFAKSAQDAGQRFFGLTASDDQVTDSWRHDHQAAYPFLRGDEKVLKTIIRANPGIVMMKDGKVLDNWAACDLPVYEEVMQKHSK
jgi:hypothetical protein